MFDERHRQRPTAPGAPRAERRRFALPLVAGVLALTLAASGCAAASATADPARDELTAALQEWTGLDEAGQREQFDIDLRELGTLLIEASGLPEQTGGDAAGIEAALTRFALTPAAERTAQGAAAGETVESAPSGPTTGSPEEMLEDAGLDEVDLGGLQGMTPEEIAALTPEELAELVGSAPSGGGGGIGLPAASPGAPVASAASPSVAPASLAAAASVVRAQTAAAAASAGAPRDVPPVTAQGAALDAARNLVEDLAFNLDRAATSGTHSSTYQWEADGLTASASVKEGMAVTGMSYETFDEIDDVSVVLESTMDSNVQVCPDAEGRVMGQFRITGTLHHADANGDPLMTRVSMNVGLSALVDDNAWASESEGDFLAEIETGIPTPAGEFDTVLVTERNSGTLAVDYYSGAQGSTIGKVGVRNARGGGPLAATGRDIAAKIQQGALAAAQKYWRTGNCVYAQVEASPEQIDRGGSSELTVTAYPMQGGSRIPVATAEYTGVNTGTVQGRVSPGAAQQTPAAFTFTAAADDGTAQPQFRVTSKRGIGFGFAVVRVGQAGWEIDVMGANGERVTGLKCDGIPGTWELTGTSDYTWAAEVTMQIGDDLSGTFTAVISIDVAGSYTDTGRAWFEARAGGYVLHTEGRETRELPVRPAAPGRCG